ncbi:DUF340 domain-containing protein [Anaerosphaera multitolerans]|uniref:DUF340 domain-containing protein n=1 Tax=Anaerosphaera multitolerans TaxID=2487351 RepID=A0A437S4I2_9FIRM|nr:DUF340 domain-containing protein [Anaerosphaera multitolerans]RVU53857.1 DUF340 domain-containing protein [Anaerosphaera multitolerans]
MKLKDSAIVLLITAFISLIGNLVSKGTSPIEALPGMLILVGVSFIGIALAKVVPFKIPSVAYIVTLSTIITVPGFPGAAVISDFVSKVDFLALCTPILAYAGIYTGKNIDSLKKTGWRIFVLALVVMVGTYIGSAIIANVVLKMLGQI